ncbi:MAG TPA: shikimate kinase [Frankiaceae bacterium]|nr:shikimate kinase [Frankiaceae bacterium]
MLLGTMGSGKTTVGRALAARLGRRYWDNDAELVARAGRTAAEVAAADGIDALHDLEASVLAAGLALPEPAVVAAPGSAALRRPSLGDAFVVWLRARPETLAARMAGGDRPELGVVESVDAERRPGFAALATYVVDTDGRTPEQVVEAIAERLRASRPFS